MYFTGTVYFDFVTFDVWRLYTTMVKASQAQDVAIEVEWRPFLSDAGDGGDPSMRGLAACEAVRNANPAEYPKFAGAMLTLVYQDQDDPGDDKTLLVAAKVAGLDGAQVIAATTATGRSLLRGSSDRARARGIEAVPTIERHGPPVFIKTTGAANYGDAAARLLLIDRMLEDDGIWSMTKPL